MVEFKWLQFSSELAVLALYHILEFVCVSIIERNLPRNLKGWLDRLLFQLDYFLALFFGWLEFFLEWHFAPGFKGATIMKVLYALGLLVAILGDALRKCAILWNSKGFKHLIQRERAPGQTLVTDGPYALSRHPAYTGWFYMVIGTQVMLGNPVAAAAYAVVARRFFADRVREEERFLVVMFGAEYEAFRARVGTLIPGVA
eukprot:gnl/Chilomastix_cuspidata/5662.p1 GENE.gnl/Chilomastix_cuspidata/5662~~gnl/Chilomastix_cuspidata/5662.p1  ORF type:complete len:201 (+),score=86.22 gnl/Chilomastix_cuspidata/5662:174-776(+)